MLYYLLTTEHEELCTSIEDAIQTSLGEVCKCECLDANADSIWYPADKIYPRIPKNFSCSADVLGFTTDGRWCKVYYGVDKQYHSSDDHNPITISHWMNIYTPETDD